MARTQTFDWLTTAILAALMLIVPIVFVLAVNPTLLDELQREFIGSSPTVARAPDFDATKPAPPAAGPKETFASTPVGPTNADENGAPGDTTIPAASSTPEIDDPEKSVVEKPVADDPIGDAEAGVSGPSSTAPALTVPPSLAPALVDPDADGDDGGLQPLDEQVAPIAPGPVGPTPAGPAPGSSAPNPGAIDYETSPAPTNDGLFGAAAAAAQTSDLQEEILGEIRSLITSQRALEAQFAALREEIDGRFRTLKSTVDGANGAAPAANATSGASRDQARLSGADARRAERAAKVLRATLEGRLVLPLGDDAGSTIEFVYVPPGRFRMGRTAAEEQSAVAGTVAAPAQEVVVDRGFFISRTEIADGQYAAFLRANYGDDPKLDAVLETRADARKPAAKVTWPFAKYFCLWLAEESGFDVRLPTEVEWEYVARGPQGALRLENDARAASSPDDVVRNVDANPSDRSWCGAVDVWGNVAEWCADAFDPAAFDDAPSGAAQVYVPGAAPADWSEPKAETRSVRGGSFADAPETRDPSERRRAKPDTSASSVGFRVVLIPDFDGQSEVGAMP